MSLVAAYGYTEQTDNAEGVLRKLHELRRTRYIPPTYLAWGHYAIGDIDGGYEWMRKACEERHLHANMLRVFTNARPDIDSDPRIHELIQGMNFPEN
jgi:hypothetical protein